MTFKTTFLTCLALLILTTFGLYAQNAQEYYQLKIYTFKDKEQQKRTDQFLEEAYLPSLHRMGFEKVGVFKLINDDKQTEIKTYVLIPFKSLKDFAELESKLSKDQNYFRSGGDYINAQFDKAPYERIESILMQAFSEMPVLKTPELPSLREHRIYELRSYESATEQLYQNKVDMFNAGGEVALFEKLKFNAVFYGEVLSGARMPNLIYMTTHENKEVRDNNWESFVKAPEWESLKSMDKYQNNVSKADIWFLRPTAYSDY